MFAILSLIMMSAPTSLAQTLPQELLGEIFVQCLPGHVFDHLQPNQKLPPLVLCHICRSWRMAALGTPQLWNEISMKLMHVSTSSRGGAFNLHARFKTLEFWGSHMRSLLPSLHLRRERLRRFSADEVRKLVLFETFFRSPVISNAQLLTLDGFSDINATKLSTALYNISFNHLEYLSIMQPSGREHRTPPPLQFSTFPALRRLHIDLHTWLTRLVTAFSWVTITHLSANLRLRRQDWSAILAQCVNLTSSSLLMEFSTDTNLIDRPATYHHNLQTLSVEGGTETFTGIFYGFIFPSLLSLRLSCTDSTTTVKHVHQAITAAPALKEFHLQFSFPMNATKFLRQPQGRQLAGALSKFSPGLVILVIDRINAAPIGSTIRHVLTLLHSSWLNDDWTTLTCTRMSVKFIFDAEPHLVEEFNREIDHCGPLPFQASACYEPGGLWNWGQLTAKELRDHWDDSLAFSSR